jgi:bifunctional non-homologous end joining protein LigD
VTGRAPSLELATLVDGAPPGDDWLHEIKLDGYRIAATLRDGRVSLWSRNGKDWTDRLGPVAEALSGMRAGSAVLDGEVVAVDTDGRTSFQKLQRELGSRSPALVYYVFDILELDGRDMRSRPLVERKRALEALMKRSKLPRHVRPSTHAAGNGPEVFEEACRMGLEGIVSKRASSPYVPGRGRDWLKVKCVLRQEFVIGGFTDPAGSRVRLGALLVGVHAKEGLRFAGRVGTGFDAKSLDDLARRLGPLERESPPFVDPPRGRDARGVHWVEPRLVAEVAFTEWTEDGQLRHPSFLGLRADKAARAVRRERATSVRKTAAAGRSRSPGRRMSKKTRRPNAS